MIQTTLGGVSHADRGPIGSAAGPFSDPVPSSRLFRSGLSVPHSFHSVFCHRGAGGSVVFYFFMDQSLPGFQPPITSRKLQIWKNIAAFCIVLPMLREILMGFLPFLGGFPELAFALLGTAAYGFLAYISSNRATRNMMFLLAGLTLLWFLLILFVDVLGVIPGLASFTYYWWIVYYLVSIYAFSNVIRNNRLDESTRSWAGVWIACLGGGLIYRVFIWLASFDLFHAYGNIYSTFNQFWWILLDILAIIGCFKLIRSDAFSGHFNLAPARSEAYYPWTRYMVAAIVVSCLVIEGLWLLEKYVAPVVLPLL